MGNHLLIVVLYGKVPDVTRVVNFDFLIPAFGLDER